MLKVKEVIPWSLALKFGILPGDDIITINGQSIDDLLDYRFFQAHYRLKFELIRQGKYLKVSFVKDIDKDIGLIFYPDRIIRCNNKCIFCFVNNNPRGLRRSLYVRDDDYRLSFQHGNFVTLTNLSEPELERIISMRLSPLYISVQATNEEVRRKLFGRNNTKPIMPILRKLAQAKIQFHCQVVLAPGINDGEFLRQTANDLASLRPYALSMAVVPVGLTSYCLTKLMTVDQKQAIKLIGEVKLFRRRYGTSENHFAYAADELFITAGSKIPSDNYYDDYPQIENGVGMVRQFLNTIKIKSANRILGQWITGLSMAEIWRKLIFPKYKIRLYLIPVVNRLFGKNVTVTGLLSGGDILAGLSQKRLKKEPIILPPNVLNEDGKFIDNMTLQELSDRIKLQVILGKYDFMETVRMLS